MLCRPVWALIALALSLAPARAAAYPHSRYWAAFELVGDWR